MDSEKNTMPKYLYHYTNVDSLALILKNRSLRLNSLERMDDLQEQISNDRQNFGKFVFISSWTADEKESIPMWRMYTPKQRGVRIKLPINPFVEYPLNVKELANITGISYGGEDAVAGFKTIIPAEELFNRSYFLINYGQGKQITQVKYTDDKDLLEPNILQNNEGNFSIGIGELGIYKNTYWEFQNEWRYRLMFFPISMRAMIQEHFHNQKTEMQKMQIETMLGQATIPFNYYDLLIKEECFEDMSIMLAPDISESAKIFVELLIKEYNSRCSIVESTLTKLMQ